MILKLMYGSHVKFIYLTKCRFFVGQGMAKEGRNQDPKRIFYSDVTDDNELHVIVGKVTIVRVASKVGLKKYCTRFIHFEVVALMQDVNLTFACFQCCM